ncbi:MAG: type II toxin-antitoxin system VapC family toxin [Acetobacteraceae bacterium]|nr:type II toxin-antitoxin system VapC family toxin [Acetobacteraceae bacterium]
MIDASVAVKWVVGEVHSEAALALLGEGVTRLAPAHWLAEAGTVLWAMSTRRGTLTRAQAEARLDFLRGLQVRETALPALLPEAGRLAFDLDLTCYDTLYLALAKREGVPVVTGDLKLVEAAQRGGPTTAPLVRWVGDLPAPGPSG